MDVECILEASLLLSWYSRISCYSGLMGDMERDARLVGSSLLAVRWMLVVRSTWHSIN
jgi:hypothetical protein